MFFSRSFLLFLGLLATVEGSQYRNTGVATFGRRVFARPRLPTPSTALTPPLSIRGGAGLDPANVGKAFAVAYLIQGSLFYLLPQQQAKLYGWLDPSSPSIPIEYLTQVLGAILLGTGVVSAYMQFVPDSTVNTGLGYGALTFVPLYLIWLVTGQSAQAGMPRTTDIFMGLANAVGAGAGLTNQDWTPQYFAVFITLFTLSALQTIVAPQASGDAWGMKREDTPEKNDRFLLLAQGFGHFLLGLEMHSALLLKGVEPAQAIALASVSGWLHFVDALLVRKKAVTIAKPPGYLFWMLYFSASIPFIVLLGEKTVDTILEE